MNIGLKIKELMSKKNLTALDISRKIGKTRQAVYHIIESEHVSTEILYKLADIFSIPVTYFFTEDEALPTAGKIESPLPTAGKARMRERKAREYNKHLATELEKERQARQKSDEERAILMAQNSKLIDALAK